MVNQRGGIFLTAKVRAEAALDSSGNVVVEYKYDAEVGHRVSGSNTALGRRIGSKFK